MKQEIFKEVFADRWYNLEGERLKSYEEYQKCLKAT